MTIESQVIVLSDEDILEAFDRIATQHGLRPPGNRGEGAVVQMILNWFTMGLRYHQFLEEAQEAERPEFAMPGLDFDLSTAYDLITKGSKKPN